MSVPDPEKPRAWLEAFCAAHCAEDALDELVHEGKGKEAATINNGGIAAQLEYLVEQLGPVEAARAVLGEGVELPDFFRAAEAPPRERAWHVTYRVGTADGAVFHQNTVDVKARTAAEASKEAVFRAHDEDPFCDGRIDYYVEIARVEEMSDDGCDDPRG